MLPEWKETYGSCHADLKSLESHWRIIKVILIYWYDEVQAILTWPYV